VNQALNKFVFQLPNRANAAAITMNITSLNNPYPYQQALYNFNSTNVLFNIYNTYYQTYSFTFNQPAFTVFSMNPSLIYINQNQPCNNLDNYPATNTIASGSTGFLILNIEFD
jgi:hypothetical protein